MSVDWTLVQVLAATECGREDCCGDVAHAWVRVTGWSAHRAFLTGASVFATTAGVRPAELAGRRFMAELDLAAAPGNENTAGERLLWPGLQVAPNVPVQADSLRPPQVKVTAASLLPAGGKELDRTRARLLAAALAPGASDVKVVRFAGNPPSKTRHRFADGKAYKTDADTNAELATAQWLKRDFRRPWSGNLAVGCVFFRKTRHLIDGDNMLKHVMDAGNGIAWHDDAQVTAKYAVVELDTKAPRTLIVVARHVSSMDRSDVAARPPRGPRR
ncbi:RusA family crossover junction endodeoxyribonuclease [Streptomyces microflavus]|uniref:RusA family crossover junction endodeoxyribonuclease n=1 Tax=Streptomyces microflavus TaxID=1919 RepID=UPI00364FF900